MEKTELKGQATPEQIEAWKAKHRNVWALKTEGSVAYVRSPGRVELSHATAVGAGNPVKFNETILLDCWLGGDTSIQTEDYKFLGISGKLDKIIEVAEVEVEKL